MKLELRFNKSEIDLLWHTGSKSFLLNDITRFELIDEIQSEYVLETENSQKCYLRWCDSFIEAKILATLLPSKTVIMWDVNLEDWCVWSTSKI